MVLWTCETCRWIYDSIHGDPEAGIDRGTAFENLPDSWACPICGSGKECFSLERKSERPILRDTEPAASDQAIPALVADENLYRRRFENIFRVAQKLTLSLEIGSVLEAIRDEARSAIPQVQEVCLLLIDPEAAHYTRPLHCAVVRDRINCQLCKRGRGAVTDAINNPSRALCFVQSDEDATLVAKGIPHDGLSELVLPISRTDSPLAVLNAIAKPGTTLGATEILLLHDLAELAGNVIENARSYWKIAQEKVTVDRMLEHLRPFVPATVQKIVEKNPASPDLKKRDMDVAVLFLDVAGYTQISEIHTREKVNFIVEKYFSSFLDIIYTRGGDINETAGDGLMVIFQGSEKETSWNAASAALEIRDKTLEINDELANRFQPIEVNMGINSGLASVGMSRFSGSSGTRMTFTASGPVTNLAARIASSAKHGDILVGPETASRIRDRVKLYDRGVVQFKNVQEPITVYSLVRRESTRVGGE